MRQQRLIIARDRANLDQSLHAAVHQLAATARDLDSAYEQYEANRQVRYLSLAVKPMPTDEPAYPRAFENTMATLLIMFGIYLMVSMTAAILREQITG